MDTCLLYMSSRIFSVLLFLTAVLFTPLDASSETGIQVKDTAEKAVATDVETQQTMEAWIAEENRLLEEVDELEARLKRVLWQRKMAAANRESLEKKINELQLRADEMKTIHRELLWVLDQTLGRLEDFVKKDIPYNQIRRIQQLSQTRKTFTDYDANQIQKARAVFDVVARETDLGYTVSVRDDEIQVENKPIRVKMLRVGRVGLWAITLDALKAYVWSREQGKWIALEKNIRDVEEAVEMAEGIRLIELSRLAVGQPVKIGIGGGKAVESN